MALTVNTNVASLTAQRSLTSSQNMLGTSLERLSTGLRINSAKDDAAGLAISERFTAQIRGLNQGVRNANDAISLSQTAEGALKEVTNNLQRIRELAVQSVNATNGSTDRAALNAEVQQLLTEIERVADQTKFNGNLLLDGNFSGDFQVGADNGQKITVTLSDDIQTAALGLTDYTSSYTGTSVVTTSALASGDVVLNGVSVGASTSTSSFGAAVQESSALAKAAAINAGTSSHGVTATAQATTITGSQAGEDQSGFTAAGTGTFTINGVTTATITGGNAATSAGNAATAINNLSGATGVTAVYNAGTGSIDFSAADGRNIHITFTAGVTRNAGAGATTETADQFGVALTDLASSKIHTATINYSSTNPDGIQFTGSGLAKLGSTVDQAASAGAGQLSIASSSSAESALTTIDSALNTVNSARATLGALQNRFTSVVANLQTTSENLSAARSRIVDADFAAETAQLTKAQILQQSGIAMLAQANAIPQNVLALLQ